MFFMQVMTASLTTGSVADAGTGAAKGIALYQGCQAELRLMQPGALAEGVQSDLINGSYCVGYLNGFLANVSTASPTICPGDRPMAEMVRAYVEYIDQHQQYLEQDKRIGLRVALEASFPCPAPIAAPSGPGATTLKRL